MFETFIRVRFHEVDGLGHVNNASYLNYIEQAAIDHATFAGLDFERLRNWGGVFVAHRHDIVFVRPTYAGEVLRIVTWLDQPQGARIVRHYRLYRARTAPTEVVVAGRIAREAGKENEQNLVVSALTEWVFASESGRPRRIPWELMAAFIGAGKRDREHSGD